MRQNSQNKVWNAIWYIRTHLQQACLSPPRSCFPISLHSSSWFAVLLWATFARLYHCFLIIYTRARYCCFRQTRPGNAATSASLLLLVFALLFSHSVKLLCWTRELSPSNDPLNRDTNKTFCLFFFFGLLATDDFTDVMIITQICFPAFICFVIKNH